MMAAAIGIITLGGLLVASALKGVSITELLSGTLAPLNPAGGRKAFQGRAGSGATGPGTDVGGGGAPTGNDARALVEDLASIARRAGGARVYVVSAFRPGSTTSGGNLSDHAGNDSSRAARDIAVRGVDAINGPPHPALDQAVVAIGEALGRSYRPGQRIVDTFTYKGLRVQVIWRTPEYGGHLGHIHVGAHRA